MLRKIKVFTREFYDNKTKQTWFFQKCLSLSNNEERVIYANIKWYIKRDLLDKLLKENKEGLFTANITKVNVGSFTNKYGEVLPQYTFEIDSLKPLSAEDSFNKKLLAVMEKNNQKEIEEVFE